MEILEEHPPLIDPNRNPEPPQTPIRRRFIAIINNPNHGAKPLHLLASITIGLIVRFAIPKPSILTTRAWQLLSLFLTTITGLILAPLPMAAWSIVCLSASLATKTLTFSEAMTAATSEVLWLIVVSFFFSRGFAKTGLGDRVAVYAVMWLGRRSIGLSYGLVVAELMVAPALPSSTARAGGVFCPVIKSLAASYGSLPRDKSARRLGAYLILSSLSFRSQESTKVETENQSKQTNTGDVRGSDRRPTSPGPQDRDQNPLCKISNTRGQLCSDSRHTHFRNT